MNLTAIILTLNEEMHIARCINSLNTIANEVIVVDSGSIDKTVDVAKSLGATVYFNDWVNHSTQISWAINKVSSNADWIIRVDADEYIDQPLKNDLKTKLSNLPHSIDGLVVKRSIIFQGKRIRFGGVGGVSVLRAFRRGKGYVTERWMDEHIYVHGKIANLKGNILDENLRPLSWWIDKHNKYASLEALEILRLQHNDNSEIFVRFNVPFNVRLKKVIKEKIYLLLPSGLRSFIYFFYRYVILLGFLDGYPGFVFHFNQGFWYRALIDAKVREVERLYREGNISIEDSILQILNIRVSKDAS